MSFFPYNDGIQELNTTNQNYNSFNMDLSVTYSFTNSPFAIVQQEFIMLMNDVGDQINYNTNSFLIKFGLGLRFQCSDTC